MSPQPITEGEAQFLQKDGLESQKDFWRFLEDSDAGNWTVSSSQFDESVDFNDLDQYLHTEDDSVQKFKEIVETPPPQQPKRAVNGKTMITLSGGVKSSSSRRKGSNPKRAPPKKSCIKICIDCKNGLKTKKNTLTIKLCKDCSKNFS
ncbi:hypothetical protein CRE_25885 [Caenorhabditis remanei]|uniref:Uncharacterized protein n=2 Tax=Caenorhabditis remanei TaxID=31234 RepID=E3NGE2_CAERE|nr:hypothetical protein CRE_25885 [Caenorhabditis remanei]